MIVPKDLVLDLLLPALQIMQIILVVRHNLPNPVHELVSLLQIEGLEDEAKPDLTISTLLLILYEVNKRRIDIREGLKNDSFHGERSTLLLEIVALFLIRILKQI